MLGCWVGQEDEAGGDDAEAEEEPENGIVGGCEIVGGAEGEGGEGVGEGDDEGEGAVDGAEAGGAVTTGDEGGAG